MKHMPPPTIPFTKEAFQKMEQEITSLRQEREEVMERLKTAREMGDLSENGAYKYAKFELGRISRRMRELNHLLTNGYIQGKNSEKTTVDFSTTVTVSDGSTEMTFMMVSAHESDLSQNKLSMHSPLGSALMGKQLGDTVTITAPKGQSTYTILSIA